MDARRRAGGEGTGDNNGARPGLAHGGLRQRRGHGARGGEESEGRGLGGGRRGLEVVAHGRMRKRSRSAPPPCRFRRQGTHTHTRCDHCVAPDPEGPSSFSIAHDDDHHNVLENIYFSELQGMYGCRRVCRGRERGRHSVPRAFHVQARYPLAFELGSRLRACARTAQPSSSARARSGGSQLVQLSHHTLPRPGFSTKTVHSMHAR